MNAADFLLATFDEMQDHAFESTTSALTGVSLEEALWQHPAYRDIEPEEGLPASGTILWHVAHLEHCSRFYANILRLRGSDQDPHVAPPAVVEWPGITDLFYDARRELREQLAVLSEADLDAFGYNGRTTGEFLRIIFRHESWHGGQIAMIRRLYSHERNVEKVG